MLIKVIILLLLILTIGNHANYDVNIAKSVAPNGSDADKDSGSIKISKSSF